MTYRKMYKLKLNGFETVFQWLKLEFRRIGDDLQRVKKMADKRTAELPKVAANNSISELGQYHKIEDNWNLFYSLFKLNKEN